MHFSILFAKLVNFVDRLIVSVITLLFTFRLNLKIMLTLFCLETDRI